VCLQGEKDVWTVEIDVDREDNTPAPLLEFVLTNGTGDWDKAPEGKNYVVDQSGVHALHNGRLTLSTGKRLMLVTDLDDTLINEDDAVRSCFNLPLQDTPGSVTCCQSRSSLGVCSPDLYLVAPIWYLLHAMLLFLACCSSFVSFMFFIWWCLRT
jgi:hypothetical protein